MRDPVREVPLERCCMHCVIIDEGLEKRGFMHILISELRPLGVGMVDMAVINRVLAT